MTFIVFLIAIVVLVVVLNLRKRVEIIERFLESGGAQLRERQKYQQDAYATPVSFQTAEIPLPPPEMLSKNDKQLNTDWLEQLIQWLKEEWLLKLGALLLLISFGWLARYAFLNNWIGPMGRITLGIIAGVLFLILGWWRIKSYLNQGGIFLVLGSTTILLTIFAAREFYDFFTPFSALTVMFLSTAFVGLASVKYRSRILALMSLILAGIAPLLTNAPAPDYIGLFSYLLVVMLGALWIVVLTGERELTMAALLLVACYSLPHLFSLTTADRGTLLLFAYAFSAVFFITNSAGILKLKGKEIMPDLITAAGNGLFLLAWIMVAAPDEWKSLLISAWMIVFAAGAFLIFKITDRREPFYVYAGVGVAMLAAATSVELNGATLTIAYAIESGIISLIVYAILNDLREAERASLLLIGPIFLSLQSIDSVAWLFRGVFHKDFFVLLTLSLILFGLGLFFLPRVRALSDRDTSRFNTALLIGGSIYAYILLWLSLGAALLNDDLAVMISLVVYTIVGLITYFYGRFNARKVFLIYGGVLLGSVVARLLLVDIWAMRLSGRIITFFLIGTLLISTAFIGRREQVHNNENNN